MNIAETMFIVLIYMSVFRVFVHLEKYVFESIKSFLSLQASTSRNVVFGAEVKGHDEERTSQRGNVILIVLCPLD